MTLSISTGWKRTDFDHMGQKISMDLKPLKYGDMINLTPYMIADSKPGETSEQTIERLMNRTRDEIIKDTQKVYEIQALAGGILPGNVKDISGIEIDGEPAKPEQLAEYSKLAVLCYEIMVRLYIISQIGTDDIKN